MKALKRHSAFIYAATAVLLATWAFRTIEGQQPAVDASFGSFPSDTKDPDSMLNHANTYYWWGRYRKNTLPEFDSAATLAKRAMELAAARMMPLTAGRKPHTPYGDLPGVSSEVDRVYRAVEIEAYSSNVSHPTFQTITVWKAQCGF